jgi:hypothetical protein
MGSYVPRKHVEAALEAAAPPLKVEAMAAALEAAADAMTRQQPGAGPWGTPQHEHQAQWLHSRAAEIRAAITD